jgi:hypothetical protein
MWIYTSPIHIQGVVLNSLSRGTLLYTLSYSGSFLKGVMKTTRASSQYEHENENERRTANGDLKKPPYHNLRKVLKLI